MSTTVATPFSDFHPDSVARRFMRVDEEGNKVFELCTFAMTFDFPTFCFIYENSWEAYQSLSDPKDPFDSVIEISDIRAAAEIVAGHLAKANPHARISYLCLPVIYGEVIRQPGEASPSNLRRAFEKPTAFAENTEGRIVFLDANAPDSFPIRDGSAAIIELSALTKYFRQVKLPTRLAH
jgi:hypothetical protein